MFDKKRKKFIKKYEKLNESWGIDRAIIIDICSSYEAKYYKSLIDIEKLGTDNLKFHIDIRKPHEYVYDVYDGWIQEDLLKIWLNQKLKTINNDYYVDNNGTDKDRVFQIEKKMNITSSPDFLLYYKDIPLKKIETQFSRDFRTIYDMKTYKVDKVSKENGVFLWVNLPENKFFILNPLEDKIYFEEYYNPAWGKTTYRITKENIDLLGGMIDMKNELNNKHLEKLNINDYSLDLYCVWNDLNIGVGFYF